MTEMVYVKGKVKWFRHTAPETFKGKSSWKHTIYPDQASLDIIRDLQAQGLKNVLKKDEDGYYINFSRPTEILRAGSRVGLDPPLVILSDGKTNYNDKVGNGSDVTTKLEVYQHGTPTGGKAKAARWLSSRIDNLIPYSNVSNTDKFDKTQHFDAYEARAMKGLAEQPPQSPGF